MMIKLPLFLFSIGVCSLSLADNSSTPDSYQGAVPTTEDWERREILVDLDDVADVEASLDEGRWHNDGFSGRVKYLITATSSAANKLFVQWLDEDDGAAAYTVSIREFNVLPEYSLEQLKCLNDECTLVSVQGTHVFEQRQQTFVVNLVGLGRYSVSLL